MDSRLLIIALVAYLLGSIPFGYILVKLFLKQDIRTTGSGNIGATNVARSGNKGLAIATLLLDAGKGALAVYLAGLNPCDFITCVPGAEKHFASTPLLMVTGALFAILGHCFPGWLLFKGGKGVATAIGAFVVLSPNAALVALICFAIVFGVTRYVSLGSVISALQFPIAVYVLAPEMRTPINMVMVTCSSLLIILKHHANIRRLIAGTEPKFGKKAIAISDPIQTEKNA